MLADESYAPGQRVAAAAGDAGVDERVKDRRSDCRSRVMTGTVNVVNITFWSLQLTPQEILRPN